MVELTEASKISKAFKTTNSKKRTSPIDKDKIIANAKEMLLAHYRATDKPLSVSAKERPEGTVGSYILKHGPYADGKLTAMAFNSRLRKEGTSIARLNRELEKEHEDFHYRNVIIAEAKETLLTYSHATGKFLVESAKEESGGFLGSYVVKHGPYAKGGGITALSLEIRLENLGTSISKLYDTIMDDLGIEGQTKKDRGRILGQMLQEFSRDVFNQFDGDKREAKSYMKTLTLNDYYKALKPYVPAKPKTPSLDQPVLAD